MLLTLVFDEMYLCGKVGVFLREHCAPIFSVPEARWNFSVLCETLDANT